MSNIITIIDNYKYSAIAEDQIRLFQLKPGGWDDELEGQLFTYKLIIEHDESQNDRYAESDIEDGSLAPPYEALSYLWGSGDPTTSIKIHSPNSKPLFLPIKQNLEEALRRFRSKVHAEDSLLLWIDAICIDQKHSTEQSAQVRKMADIYAQAEKVRVWLGKESEDSPAAIKFIQRLLTLEKFDQLSKDPVSAEEWDALRNLVQRPWFKRRWIVQEIAYARKARVYCGRDELPWENLAGAVSLFALKREDLRDLFQKAPKFAHNPDYLGEIEGFGAKTLVDTIDIVMRKSEDGDVLGHLLPLEALVSTLTDFDATFPQDYIYAILWLCNDARPGSKLSRSYDQHKHQQNTEINAAPYLINGEKRWTGGDFRESPAPVSPRGRSRLRAVEATSAREPSVSPMPARRRAERESNVKPPTIIFVDYEKSMYALCQEFIEFAVTQSNSLDIICRPWVPAFTGHKPENQIASEDKMKMPSWLVPLSRRPYGIRPQTEDRVYNRVAADTLIGTSLTGLKNYSASASTSSFWKANQLIQDRKLTARGFILDSIGEAAPRASNAILPADWLTLDRVGWGSQEGPPPEHFWRTLVANRATSKGPERPPSYWQWACKWMFDRRVKHENGHLDLNQLLMNVSGKCQSVVVDFIHRVRAVIWNRRLFESSGQHWNPFLGLGPATAEKGDLICILVGCSVPVLLRRNTNSVDSMPGQKRRRDDDVSPAAKRRRKSIRQTPAPQKSWISVDEASLGTGAGIQGSLEERQDDMPAEVEALAPATQDTTLSGKKKQTGHIMESQAIMEDDQYTLIGECYAHGFMDGEAFRVQEQAKIKFVDFCIV
jgi:Heterokaryon incompatibility protein (HET)